MKPSSHCRLLVIAASFQASLNIHPSLQTDVLGSPRVLPNGCTAAHPCPCSTSSETPRAKSRVLRQYSVYWHPLSLLSLQASRSVTLVTHMYVPFWPELNPLLLASTRICGVHISLLKCLKVLEPHSLSVLSRNAFQCSDASRI